jgi:acyl-coenzyme A thioesterase PaaI-like protein
MKAELDARRGLSVREDGYCFACGPENLIGLKLDFHVVNGRAEATFVPRREHQGFAGIIHGGLIGLVLDEAMAKLLYLHGIEAFTCEITVRLRRVVGIGEPLRVTAFLVGERRRLLELEALASDRHGETVAVAHAKFLRVGAGET